MFSPDQNVRFVSFPVTVKKGKIEKGGKQTTTYTTQSMATELAVQTERAYLKQPHIFQNAKVSSDYHKKGPSMLDGLKVWV